jgi:hypothetical protein
MPRIVSTILVDFQGQRRVAHAQLVRGGQGEQDPRADRIGQKGSPDEQFEDGYCRLR